MRLDDRVAVVTGGGQGIGREIALRLGQEGAIVVIADINAKASRETAEMFASKWGRPARVCPTDVGDERQAAHLMRTVSDTEKRLDILVNNAGIMGPVMRTEEIALDEWRATFAVNLDGVFLCCKYAIPLLKSSGRGCIVNISSITGKRPLPLRSPYAASKMGLIGFTRTLAAELGEWKIRVNSVCPGGVVGPRLNSVLDGVMAFSGKSREQVVAERLTVSPLKTFVDPADVAGVVAFLCSDDSVKMTGQDINVSAGAVMY